MGGFEDARIAKAVIDSVKRLGNIAPKSVSEMSKLQQRLVASGFRSTEALVVFFGIRIGVALGAFALFASPLVMRPDLTTALVAALGGYVLPGIVLARLAKRRQHTIRLALPDALDLLVVSVEAGLGLDQALQQIGRASCRERV